MNPRFSQAPMVPRWLLALVVLLPLVTFTIDLGTPSLWDPDEGRCAEIAREMLLTGDWLTPSLNFQPYHEKPPVYYWLLASTLRSFGQRNEAAARLPSVVVALCSIWLVLAWGWRHLRPIAGALAALILASAAGYVAVGRLVLDDAVAGFLLAIALLSMSEPLVGRPRRFPWLFYGSLSGASLLLGPAALTLVTLVGVSFVMLVREPARLLDLRPFAGAGFLIAVTGPIFALMIVHDPTYVSELLWGHGFLRLFDISFGAGRPYPLLLYLALGPALLLPWGIFLPWSLRDAFRSGGERSPDARLYLIVWLTGSVLFFLFSSVNLVASVPVVFVPMALLTARSLARLIRRPASGNLLTEPLYGGGAVLFVILIAAPFLTYKFLQTEFPMYADKIVYAFLLIPFALAGLAAVASRSRMGTLAAVAASGVASLVGLYHFGAETVSAFNSMEFPAELISRRLPQEAPIVSWGTTTHTLAFYSGRPVQPLVRLEDAAPLLEGRMPAALLTKERNLSEVRSAIRRPLYIWWIGDSKKILLANLPPPTGGDRRILLPIAATRGPSPSG